MLHEIICVIPFFNFNDNPILVANHNATIQDLDAHGIPNITIECLLPHQLSTLDCSRITVSTSSVLWQKEALLNHVFPFYQHVPYIVWLDSGILMSEGWIDETLTALQSSDVVQCFTFGIFMRKDGIIDNISQTSFAYSFLHKKPVALQTACTGAAMAARSSVFKTASLYPYCIVGGGDTRFMNVFRTVPINCRPACNTVQFIHYNEWLTEMRKLDLKLGYSNKTFFTHLWHMNQANRQIGNRQAILKYGGYNPVGDTDLINGTLEWTDIASSLLKKEVEQYIRNRV